MVFYVTNRFTNILKSPLKGRANLEKIFPILFDKFCFSKNLGCEEDIHFNFDLSFWKSSSEGRPQDCQSETQKIWTKSVTIKSNFWHTRIKLYGSP